MDAIIHDAGTYSTAGRSPTSEGHPAILAVNTLAPYMLSALIERPDRLIYLSSGMHRSGVASLRDIDWLERITVATGPQPRKPSILAFKISSAPNSPN
jgi:hypothetical protein